MNTGSRNGPLRRVAASVLAVLMLLAAFSLWTLIPLAWLWIGSQVAATQFPSLGPYLIVLFGVIFSILAVAWLLGLMNELYMRLTGSHTVEPIRPGWLTAMTDTSDLRQTPTLLEAVIIGSVIIAAITFVVWFLTSAGSSLPG
jgi:hypothetical protein